MLFKMNKRKKLYKKTSELIDQEKYDETIECLKEKEDIFGEEYYFNYSYGYCYLMKKNYEKALKLFNKCLELKKYDKNAVISKIECLVHLKKFDEALQVMNDYIANTNDDSPEILNHKKELEMLNNISEKGIIQININ